MWSSHYLRGRVCTHDRVCRAQCRADYDCQTLRAGLACNTDAGVCLGHPFLDDAGAFADVLRNDPGDNVDPVVGAPSVRDAGTVRDARGVDAPGPCALREASGACDPGVIGCDITDVSPSGEVSCALFTGGTVRCWTTYNSGYLGNGAIGRCSTPGLVRDLTQVRSLHRGGLDPCVRGVARR